MPLVQVGNQQVDPAVPQYYCKIFRNVAVGYNRIYLLNIAKSMQARGSELSRVDDDNNPAAHSHHNFVLPRLLFIESTQTKYWVDAIGTKVHSIKLHVLQRVLDKTPSKRPRFESYPAAWQDKRVLIAAPKRLDNIKARRENCTPG